MNDSLALDHLPCVDHDSLATMRAALAPHGLLFSAAGIGAETHLPESLRGRFALHRWEGAACVTIDALSHQDIEALPSIVRAALVVKPHALSSQSGPHELVAALHRAGLRLFVAQGSAENALTLSHGVIGSLEFMLSTGDRLQHYPLTTSAKVLSDASQQAFAPTTAVFVLDLIQDFEVLQPMLALAARPFGPFSPLVAVTERVQTSHLWQDILAFLSVLAIPWFKAIGSQDVVNALGSKRSVLITASETSAPGHRFSHVACRSAPARALRVTFQHGYECVGLRHHLAHDLQFPQGVRFESDALFTWRSPDDLPNLHPADRDKCIPVGVTKGIAEKSAVLVEAAWQAGQMSPTVPTQVTTGKLIVAENLHSVRFGAPRRYQRFLRFIEQAHAASDPPVLVRSHPGKRTLEKAKSKNPYAFLGGTLTAAHFAASRALISPPSTIVLDAACCALPVALWTDSANLGDVANYRGLPSVQDAHQIHDTLLADPQRCGLTAYGWAVANTTALNGIPAAWDALRTLCQ